MIKSKTLIVVAMLVMAVTATGGLGALAADAPTSAASGNMGQHSAGSMKMHQAMMSGMNDMKMTGDTDKDFAQMMIHHHKQAIEMSKAQLEHGRNAELKARAQKIIDDSQKDIAALQTASAKLN
jgi:uncharacterized protein (DUF305 family)